MPEEEVAHLVGDDRHLSIHREPAPAMVHSRRVGDPSSDLPRDGRRRGLWKPKPGNWGTIKLTTVGRKTGKEREAILGYFEEGPNLVTMAINGWMEAEPAWWLNLQARPEARVETKDGTRRMRGRAAVGEEHDRLWAKWAEINEKLDGYATRRPGGTAIVILEPVAE
jgi:deazaflavin-dependent oxidoreductase (nitroreductase family)